MARQNLKEFVDELKYYAKLSSKNSELKIEAYRITADIVKRFELPKQIPIVTGQLLADMINVTYYNDAGVHIGKPNLKYAIPVDQGFTHWYTQKFVKGRFFIDKVEKTIFDILFYTFSEMWTDVIINGKKAGKQKGGGITVTKLKDILRSKRVSARPNTTGQFVTLKYVKGGKAAGAIVIPRGSRR